MHTDLQYMAYYFDKIMWKLAVILLSALALEAQTLMPLPVRMVAGQGSLRIDEKFLVAFEGRPDRRVAAGAGRLSALVSRKTGIPMPGARGFETLMVKFGKAGDEDESYRLTVTPEHALLEAPGPVGVLRGFATFAQLVELGPDGFRVPAVEIEDRPRFPWRGLLLDVARHWMPMDVVKRTLDGMAAVKLNVFHWHLSDDQGFRIESKRYPKLHEMGSDGYFFTQDQVREIIEYARRRGIRVVPEFDMPGHTTSWFVGHPELASAAGPYKIERGWGIFDPSMDPSRDVVYQFLDGLIGEMAALFPDPYFHIGGDEVTGKQWDANPRIQEFMRAHGMKNNHDLQAHFTKRVQQIVSRHGKRMIGWDEILHPDLPRDIVVHSWRGQKSLGEAARQGFTGILSHGYYLDLVLPAVDHYLPDPINADTAGLSEEEKKRILGGEACMWAERVTAENVDGRIWPRAAAVAERLWSPAGVRDVDSMYRRLEAVSRELEWNGLTHRTTFRTMVERLAGAQPAGPVAVLAEVVEPIKNYAREKARPYTSLTALNRMVDTALPESAAAREFAGLVETMLARRTGAVEIRRRLIAWRDNDARLAPAMAQSALLAEMAPVSKDLAALAAAGLEALEHLERGTHAPAGWVEKQQSLVKAAAGARAEVLLVVAAPLGKLIEAAR